GRGGARGPPRPEDECDGSQEHDGVKGEALPLVAHERSQRGEPFADRGRDRAGHLAGRSRAKTAERRAIPKEKATGRTPSRLANVGEGGVGAAQLARDTILEHQGGGPLILDLRLSRGDGGDRVDRSLGQAPRGPRRAAP